MGRIERNGVTYVYADATAGHQSIADIIQNFGTLYVMLGPPLRQYVNDSFVLSGIYSRRFEFEISINNGQFRFVRNGHVVSRPLPRVTGKSIHCFARWDPESIDVVAVEDGHDATRHSLEALVSRIATPFTVVPEEIVLWAREQNYLPSTAAASAGDFFVEFADIVREIQTKVDSTAAHRMFWDFKQGKGEPPVPKLEPQITAAIHMLLIDSAIHKDFQVVPQAGALGGNLDFQINKVIEGGRLAVLAMEAKNAHAVDIERGLFRQLPAYMRAVSAEFGIFLVLWFKGKDFNQPQEADFERWRLKLKYAPPSNVRIMHLDLSIPPPPSKR